MRLLGLGQFATAAVGIVAANEHDAAFNDAPAISAGNLHPFILPSRTAMGQRPA